MGFGHFSAEKIEKERAADAFDFVCGNRDSDACAAQKNPETVSAVFKLRASSERDIRVIHCCRPLSSDVCDLIILFS